MEEASIKGKWAKNAIQMTQAWIRDGLHERAITRDLKWGIPVPKKGFEDKVFYVWFDAPIGYISITKALADKLQADNKVKLDWKSWWLPTESDDTTSKTDVELFQFIGKDNIPFHTVIFQSTLIGSQMNWTKLYHMSSTEYLNYESGKFSKSKGIGVFGNDAKESGIPADAWRFYMFYNRPEKSDTQFLWKDFQEKYNGELIGNLGNLVNRTLTFVSRYYDGKIPSGEKDNLLWEEIEKGETKITELLDWAELKDAFHEIFALSSIANKAFQDGEPWKTRNTDPEKAAKLIKNLCYVIKDLMIMAHPYMPQYTAKVMSFFGKTIADPTIDKPAASDSLTWQDLGIFEGLENISSPEIYFTTMDNKTIEAYRERYSGNQKERNAQKTANKDKKSEKKKSSDEPKKAKDPVSHFNDYISLKTAKILKVEKHPEADKLYIETLDDGSDNERIILSGLVPYLTPEQLLGKTVVIADNLKPRKMRGIESHGMLLAADYKDENGKECVEVLDCSWAKPGSQILLEGTSSTNEKPEEIDADNFFAVDILVKNNTVCIGDKALMVEGQPIKTIFTVNGEVH